MAKRLDTVWPLEPHTAAKHAILKRYLQAWLLILGRSHGRIVYIDAFAGPGEYSGGEPGSPLIALRTAIDQEQYLPGEVDFLFVEKDRDRVEHLERLIGSVAAPGRFVIETRRGECDAVINALLDRLESAKDALAPTFAFLDPFGFSHTPMSLITRLMKQRRCEVLITFMFEEINRFLIQEQQPKRFDELFGTPDWRRALDQPSKPARRAFLKDLYQSQLREAAGIRHVLAFEMRNRTDGLDYILFFGSNSIDGLMKMKESMWKVDPVAGFTFSDATDPGQSVLFEAKPDANDVRRRLLAEFAGKTVMVDAVQQFILERTPYRETHYKKVLRSLEYATPPGIRVPHPASNRRPGTFPSGTMIEFAPATA